LDGSYITNRRRENPFVQIDKNVFEDTNISWKAKGMLGYLLSKPEGWKVYVTDLKKRSKDGRDAVSSGLKELETAGYLKKHKLRQEGKFAGYNYEIFEYPTEDHKTVYGNTENGKSGNGLSGNGKPVTSNNDCSNKEDSKNDETENEEKIIHEWLDIIPDDLKEKRVQSNDYTQAFETFWTVYPRKKEKKKAFGVWKTRIREGVTDELLIKCATNYAGSVQAEGTEERYIKHAATFLGPTKPYEEYTNPVQPTRRGGSGHKQSHQPPADEFDELSF
jgi:hypothetical protein